MTQQIPPNEADEPDEADIHPEPVIPRFIVRVGWVALAVGLYGIFMTDIGEPVTLPDGTEQATSTGKILGVMLLIGFVVVFFSSSLWALLQAVCIFTGLFVGIEYFTSLGPDLPKGVGLIGGTLGFLTGWGVGYLLTRVLSWLFDRLRLARRRGEDRQYIDQNGESGGDNNG